MQDPVPLIAGQQYAIVLSSESDCLVRSGPDGDSYAGGDSYANDDRIPLFPQVRTAMTPRRDLPLRTKVGRRADAHMTFESFQWLWRLTPDQRWIQLRTVSPVAMITGNFDADPTGVVAVDFASAGDTDFAGEDLVADFDPSSLVLADLGGYGANDIVFGATVGIWILRDSNRWTWLHPFTSEGISVADRDGSGRDDLLIDFGSAWGLWQYSNDQNWSQVHPYQPTLVSPRRFR